MANPDIKLYYFDGKGRAEVARLLLAAAGKEYEDIRYDQDGWPEYKPLAPLGQCPFIKVDDDYYGQSLAINLYLARELGFHGETNLESLKIDQIVFLVEDFFKICVDVFHVENEDEKKAATEKTKAEVAPKFLNQFEKLLAKNDTGYFVSDRLTLADIAVFDVITGMLGNYAELNDDYPLLQKHVETVKAHGKLGSYFLSRPERPF